MSLKTIIEGLVSVASTNRQRAYRILGAEPGPGVDVLIKPVVPMCGQWHVYGMSQAGTRFVAKFWRFQPLSNQQLATMKHQILEWEMTFKTQYPIMSLEDSTVRELGDP